MVNPYNRTLFSNKIEVHCQAMKKHGWTLNAYFSVKEVSLKKLYTIWFKLYNLVENAKLHKQKDLWFLGFLRKRRLNRWDSKNFFGSDNILYNIVMLVIKLCICQNPSNIKAQRWTLIYLNFKKSLGDWRILGKKASYGKMYHQCMRQLDYRRWG